MTESIINRIIATRPDHDGAITVTGLGHRTTMPLAEFYDRAKAVAGALRHRGIGAGDRIGILSANRLEWVLLDLAALMIKAQTAGFEPGKFSPDTELIERYGLDLLYTDVPLSDDAPSRAMSISTIAGHAEEAAAALDSVEWGATECTTVKFTSGSTGVPKGLEATVSSRSLSGSRAASSLRFPPVQVLGQILDFHAS